MRSSAIPLSPPHFSIGCFTTPSSFRSKAGIEGDDALNERRFFERQAQSRTVRFGKQRPQAVLHFGCFDDAPRIGREYLYAFSAFGWPRRGCGAMAHPMRSSADPSAMARVPSW
jgi:hypothetical protein